jgi:hypothetical protein
MGFARVGGNAARVGGASAGARVTKEENDLRDRTMDSYVNGRVAEDRIENASEWSVQTGLTARDGPAHARNRGYPRAKIAFLFRSAQGATAILRLPQTKLNGARHIHQPQQPRQ